jgi:hypothetical protein
LGKDYIIPVPTITGRGGAAEFQQLVNWCDTTPGGANVVFDFSSCGRLPLNAVVFLGGFAALIRARGGTVKVRADTLKTKIFKDLEVNGLLEHLGIKTGRESPRRMPFEHHAVLDKSRVMNYLENEWLGAGAVKLSADLRAAIMGNTWEVYANAFDHAESPIGIVNCGTYERSGKRLRLSVMDLGTGIPETIRRYRPLQPIDAQRAMKWAFAQGTSTKAEIVGYSRGLGLYTLKEFIKVNKGFMEVFSNDGYVKINHQGEVYRQNNFSISGTFVHISLPADERFYCFDYEVPKYAPNPAGR